MEIEIRDATHAPGKIWHKKGNIMYWHREDGPAAIMKSGKEEWYYYNCFYKFPEDLPMMPLNIFLAYLKWELNKKEK